MCYTVQYSTEYSNQRAESAAHNRSLTAWRR